MLAGCISHGLMQMSSKKSGTFSRPPAPCFSAACVCSFYRQGGDLTSMQGLVDLLQNDISHKRGLWSLDHGLPMTRLMLTARPSREDPAEAVLACSRPSLTVTASNLRRAGSVRQVVRFVDRQPLVGWSSVKPTDMPAIRMAMRYSCEIVAPICSPAC